jgi:two-component system chemotaxis response regulator CheV
MVVASAGFPVLIGPYRLSTAGQVWTKDKQETPDKCSNVPLLICNDSPLLNRLIVDCLKEAGYQNFIHMKNGVTGK